MSRPLRIEYPGAWHHVMNRGRRGEDVFTERNDYSLFIELLQETSEIFNIKIAAYCLMPNHYHLLIHTPEKNLSKSLRQINGLYAQQFNRIHGYDGQLFRGRYKNILVEADSYLLELLRYIHKNPLRGGLSRGLDDYEWSSYRGYLTEAKKWDWLYKDFPLSLFAKNKKDSLREFKKFMENDKEDKISQIFQRKRLPPILGKEEFVNRIKKRFFAEKMHIEIPDSKRLAPQKEIIQELVCRAYGVGRAELFKSRRGIFNEPRNVSIYLIRTLRSDGLIDICKEYNLKKYSSASSIIESVKKRMFENKKFRVRVNELSQKLINSQPET